MLENIGKVYSSPGWIGLISNLLTVWVLLAVSIWVLARTGNSLGAENSSGLQDAPWTPPGAFIGGVWTVLYTLMALSLWILNQIPTDESSLLKYGVIFLIAFCLVWPFYAFSNTSRVPGLVGNIGILIIVLFLVWRLYPSSKTATFLVAPVGIWISIAIASILDAVRRYGW